MAFHLLARSRLGRFRGRVQLVDDSPLPYHRRTTQLPSPPRSPNVALRVPFILLEELLATERIQEKFSIFWFSALTLAQYALLLVGFRFLLPGVWEQQFAGG